MYLVFRLQHNVINQSLLRSEPKFHTAILLCGCGVRDELTMESAEELSTEGEFITYRVGQNCDSDVSSTSGLDSEHHLSFLSS
jgi:hypothetical protein